MMKIKTITIVEFDDIEKDTLEKFLGKMPDDQKKEVGMSDEESEILSKIYYILSSTGKERDGGI